MSLSISEKAKIKSKVFAKISNELDIAIRDDELSEFLDKYGIVLEAEERLPINTRLAKILVFGQLAGSKKDYQITAKKFGINPDNIEFLEYDEAKRFPSERLRNSTQYSDIIYGPAPHKCTEMGDTSSLLEEIRQRPMEYPRLIEAKSNTKGTNLKISISTFKDCLAKTFYYESMVE